MKKIIAILLVLCMLFAFAGCGATKDPDPKPSVNNLPADEYDEDETETKEFPTLEGTDDYVVVRKKGKSFEVKDITEIKNFKVGYVRNSDSELIALYYCEEGDAHVAGHGTDHDVFSDLSGGNVDIAICRKSAAEAATDRFEIILDPIEMIEIK